MSYAVCRQGVSIPATHEQIRRWKNIPLVLFFYIPLLRHWPWADKLRLLLVAAVLDPPALVNTAAHMLLESLPLAGRTKPRYPQETGKLLDVLILGRVDIGPP